QVLLFAPNGKSLVREAAMGITRLWDLATGKEIWKRGRVDEKSLHFAPEAFFPDGKTLIGRENYEAIVFLDTTTGRELRRFVVPVRGSTLVFSTDRKILAAPRYGRQKRAIELWDTTTGKKLLEVPGRRG